MNRLPIKPQAFKRLTEGHPWIFKGEITSAEFVANHMGPAPAVVPIGEHYFLYSPDENIAFRRVGPSLRNWPVGDAPERHAITTLDDFEKTFSVEVIAHLKRLWQTKRSLTDHDRCFRWIFSENDLLPGLTVDAFDVDANSAVLSVTRGTEAVRFFWPALARMIKTALAPLVPKFHLSDSTSEPLETLALQTSRQTLWQTTWQTTWNGLQWTFNLADGQKTGAYLDQRENHRATVRWAEKLGIRAPAQAWDVFSYEGGFALHLARAGFEVLCVDQSERALETLVANARLNGLTERVHVKRANAFEFLKADTRTPSIIVLDPPPFARSKSGRTGALQGMKDLALRAFQKIGPQGLVVLCSCSHSVTPGDLEWVARQAAHDARRTVSVLEVRGPSPDHAPALGFPEGQYLQAWFFHVH